VHAAQTGKKKALITFLLLTMLLGSVFLGVKAVEYHHKWEDGLVPGPHFQISEKAVAEMAEHHHVAPASHLELYFCFYFFMTGLHALHMIVGLGIMTVLVWMAAHGRFEGGHYSPVEVSGLYWHFVDIVWIFLFPLLYLIGGRY
jgi:cytochrome c oxidase subunit 3